MQWRVVGIIIIILGSIVTISIVTAQLLTSSWEMKKFGTKTIIRGNNCNDYYNPETQTGNIILGRFPEYVMYNGSCTDIETIPSLKPVSRFVKFYLEKDSDYEIEIDDFNYTCIKKLKIKSKIDGFIPFKINGITYVSPYFESENEIELEDICTENIFNYNFTLGESSTTIQLQDADTENLEDAYVYQSNPDTSYGQFGRFYFVATSVSRSDHKYSLIKFNISSIPSGQKIENAQLGLYMSAEGIDTGESYNVTAHHYTVQNWDELTITWNNYDGGNYNAANESSWVVVGPDPTPDAPAWINFTVTNIVAADYRDGNSNCSILLLSILLGGDPTPTDDIDLRSKEEGVTSLRPFLNITYTTLCSGGTCVFDDDYVLADITYHEDALQQGDVGFQMKWDISELCDLSPASIDGANLNLYITAATAGDDDSQMYYIRNQTWDESTSAAGINTLAEYNSTTTSTFSSLTDETRTNISVLTMVQEACNREENLSFRIEDQDYAVETIVAVVEGTGLDFGSKAIFQKYLAFGSRTHTTDAKRPKLFVSYTETAEDVAPKWFDNSTNGTQAGTNIEHRVRWTDDNNLSGYIFSFCNGTWNGSDCLGNENTFLADNLDDCDPYSAYPEVDYGACQWMVFDDDIKVIIKFNITQIPSNGVVTFSEVCLYVDENEVDAGESFNIDVHHVYSFPSYNISDGEWIEGDDADCGPTGDATGQEVDWNNLPNSSVQMNLTYSARKVVDNNSPINEYYCWNVSDIINNAISSDDSNVTILWNISVASGAPSTTDDYSLHSKEWGTPSQRPFLNITYSSGGWVNDSFVSMTGTNNWSNVTKPVNTTVGANIAWRVYANDSQNQWNSTDVFNYTTNIPFNLYVNETSSDSNTNKTDEALIFVEWYSDPSVNVDACILELNNGTVKTNYTGTANENYCNHTVSDLEGLNWTYRGYANMSNGDWNVTSEYWVNINLDPTGYWVMRAPVNSTNVYTGNSLARRWGGTGAPLGNGRDVGVLWRNSTLDDEGRLHGEEGTDEERHCGAWTQFFFDEIGYDNGTIENLYCHMWMYTEETTLDYGEGVGVEVVGVGIDGEYTSGSYYDTERFDSTLAYPTNVTKYHLQIYWNDALNLAYDDDYNFTGISFKGSGYAVQMMSYISQRSFCIVNVNTSSWKTDDNDGDGLTDYEEMNVTFTDPYDADTDDDGKDDLFEYNNNKKGYDPYDWGIIHKLRLDGDNNTAYVRELNNQSGYVAPAPHNSTLDRELTSDEYDNLTAHDSYCPPVVGDCTNATVFPYHQNSTHHFSHTQINIVYNISKSISNFSGIINSNMFYGGIVVSINNYDGTPLNKTMTILNVNEGENKIIPAKEGHTNAFYLKQIRENITDYINVSDGTMRVRVETSNADSGSDITFGWSELWIITGENILNITAPTTANPINVSEGDMITVNFTFQEEGTEIISGVDVINITINNTLCTLLTSDPTYKTDHWEQNCTAPELAGGKYNLTIYANTSSSGILTDTEINATLYKTLNITAPTTANPVNVIYPQNITVNFTVMDVEDYLTSGVEVINITIGTTLCPNTTAESYAGGNIWQQNCSVPDLIGGSYYNLTIWVNHTDTDELIDIEVNATYYTPDVGFLITLVDDSITISNSTGNKTKDLEFNSTTGNEKNVSSCIVGQSSDCQTSLVGMYRFNNTGNVNEKWIVKLNTSLPSSIVVWGSLDNDPETNIILINDTNWATINSSIPVDAQEEAWIWANFTDAAMADSAVIRITMNSTEA